MKNVDYSKCLKYTFNKYRGTYVVSGVNKNAIVDGKVVIPETYKGKVVSDVERYAFENCTALKSITLSDEIRTLQTSAFLGCTNLSEVVFGKNLWQVRFSVFENCYSLTELVLPDSVEEFIAPLKGCSSLKKLVLSRNLKKFFLSEKCDNLEFNELDGCKYLGTDDNPYFCFVEAKIDGNDVYINELTNVIGSDAFGEGYDDDNEELKPFTIRIPSACVGVNARSFLSKSIKAFVVDEDNKSFKSDGDCLYSRNGDTLVCYPRAKTDEHFVVNELVETISENAIHGNPYIKSLDLSNVSSIEHSGVSRCPSLKEIVFNEGLTVIGRYAFAGDVALERAELKEGLDRINAFAFDECVSLESAVIPATTRYIGSGAFYNCSSLKNIAFTKKEGWRILTKKDGEYVAPEDEKIIKKWSKKLSDAMSDERSFAKNITSELRMLNFANGNYKNDGAGKVIKY